MLEAPQTRASLLVRIRDGRDQEAWRQFVQVYAPVVYGFARKRGLQDADAADVMQDVLRSVAGAAARLNYDPARGSFRGWLYTVARNKIFNFLEAGHRKPDRGSGDSGTRERLEALAGPEWGLAESWDEQYERNIAALAMDRVRDEVQAATWQAFWQTAVEGRSAREAGEALRMSAGAVYVARSRVLARLKEEVQRLQEQDV
jgi:RNA polymerase sigma-70 factor (ECF subfamily)